MSQLSPAVLRLRVKHMVEQYGMKHPQALTHRAILGNVLISTKSSDAVKEGVRECESVLAVLTELQRGGSHTKRSMHRSMTGAPPDESDEKNHTSSPAPTPGDAAVYLRLQHHILESLLQAPPEEVPNQASYREDMKRVAEHLKSALSTASADGDKNGTRRGIRDHWLRPESRPEYEGRPWARDARDRFNSGR